MVTWHGGRKSAAQKPPKQRDLGFTMIEMMIVIAIAGVLSAIAVPSFQAAIANQRAKAFAQELYLALNKARSEAIKLNGTCDVVVDFSDAADWAAGWSVASVEPPAAGTTCLDPRTISSAGGLAGIKTAGGADVTFFRRGRPDAAVSFTVCDEKGKAKERVVATSVSGMATVTKTQTACTP